VEIREPLSGAGRTDCLISRNVLSDILLLDRLP
jgi:hypothetical protein